MLQSYLYDRRNLAVACTNCPTDLTLSGIQLSSQVFQAANDITSTQDIVDGVMVDYQAGNSIKLLPGFTAEYGCDFHAFIQACGSARVAQLAEGLPEIPEVFATEMDFAEQLDNKATTKDVILDNSVLDFHAFPNPFSHSTTLTYTLAANSPVTLAIFDMTGRLVTPLVQEQQAKSQYVVRLDKHDLPAGVYMARLQVGDEIKSLKLMVLQSDK